MTICGKRQHPVREEEEADQHAGSGSGDGSGGIIEERFWVLLSGADHDGWLDRGTCWTLDAGFTDEPRRRERQRGREREGNEMRET